MIKKSGFTLVETVITLGIISLLVGLGMFFSFGFYESYLLETEKNVLASLLRKARAQSLNNLNQAKHGVYLDLLANRYLVFEGDSYASRNQALDEVVYQGSKTIQISGSQEVIFEQLTGNLSQNQEIILQNQKQAISIIINQQGGINY